MKKLPIYSTLFVLFLAGYSSTIAANSEKVDESTNEIQETEIVYTEDDSSADDNLPENNHSKEDLSTDDNLSENNHTEEDLSIDDTSSEIVYTAEDEDLSVNGTLSDGIHSTSVWLDILVSDIELYTEMEDIGPLIDYINGAIILADKVNASPEIKEELKEVLELIETGLTDEDITKLQQANDILKNLDRRYNESALW